MSESSLENPNRLTRFAILALVLFALLGAVRIGIHIRAIALMFSGDPSVELHNAVETCQQFFGLPPVQDGDEEADVTSGGDSVDSCEKWAALSTETAGEMKPATMSLLGVSFLLSAATFFIAVLIVLRKRTAALWAKRIFYGQLLAGVAWTVFAVFEYLLSRDATEQALPGVFHSGFGSALHGIWLTPVITYVVLAFLYKGLAVMVASPRMREGAK